MVVIQKPSPLWNVPYARNQFFTGRVHELQFLHQELQVRDAVALSQPQAITGLGGIGKTQMALEYAYRYGSTYTAVLWVRATTSPELVSSFVELARVLNLPEQSEQDQGIIVKAVQQWLRLHRGWLLIFDNMDDPSIARPFLPSSGSGHLLLTTRAQALSDLAQCVEVQPMKPEVGALLLLRRAKIIPLQATVEYVDGTENGAVARDISMELDGLPLALDQAGAYIHATSCSLRDYLALYQIRRENLLRERGSSDQNYPASVATTWSLSFEKVQLASPAAAELLNFCAFLAPDAIPEAMVAKGATHLGEILAPVVADPIQMDLACKEVLKYSLVQREPDTGILAIHRLVQAVLQGHLTSTACAGWKRRTVLAVNAFDPEIHDVREWGACEQWIPHVLVCVNWIEQERIYRKESADLLNLAGLYLYNRGRYHEIEPLLRRALAIRQQALGPEHRDVATTLNNLAELYRIQGRYTQVEPLLKQALSIYERRPEGSDLLKSLSLNNLALLYHYQGKYAQAEPLFEQALAIKEKQLGVGHPETVISLNNLATFYMERRKYARAEPLFERALSIYEQELGGNDIKLAFVLSNLATLYRAQGKYAQAESFYWRSLEIREKVLGVDHPDTATSLNNLATLYLEQGKLVEAEIWCKEVLEIREKLLGVDHPDSAPTLNNLAQIYSRQGRDADAEPLYRRVVAIYEQQFGSKHPQTRLAHFNYHSVRFFRILNNVKQTIRRTLLRLLIWRSNSPA